MTDNVDIINVMIYIFNCLLFNFVEKKNRVNKEETATHSPLSPIEINKVPNQVSKRKIYVKISIIHKQ